MKKKPDKDVGYPKGEVVILIHGLINLQLSGGKKTTAADFSG